MGAVGTPHTRLILLRGNSASGKSSLARSIRASRPRGIAILGQDQLCREILHAREEPGNPTIGYIDLSARYALGQGLHVIIEGILYADIYGVMLTELLRDHRGVSHCYRYEIPFRETARRHANKPEAAAYGPETMWQWWRDSDPLPGMTEQVLGPEISLTDATAQILADCGWRHEPPIS